MQTKAPLAAAIDALQPSERVKLSQVGEVACYAERSGDGRRLRFVRETRDGFEVYVDAEF
jgi:hypothetical protein